MAEALHHRLLCSLDGDTAEILRGDVELKRSTDLRRSVLLLCKAHRNLVELVLVVVIGNDGKGSENSGITFLGINVSTQLLDGIRTWNHFPVGGNERKLQRGNDLLTINAFFFFVVFDECDDVVGHGWRAVCRRFSA